MDRTAYPCLIHPLIQTGSSDALSCADSSTRWPTQLLREGASYITQARDGMVHPGDPSFAYGFVPQRNPRTFAGVATGRACWSPSTGARSTSLVLHSREVAIAAAFVVWAVIAAVLAQTGRHQLTTITGIPRTVETAK